MQSAYEMAKKNYGKTWTIEMLQALVTKGKLTIVQYEEITGQTYDNPTDINGNPLTTLDGLKAENASLKEQLTSAQADNIMALDAIATLYELVMPV